MGLNSLSAFWFVFELRSRQTSGQTNKRMELNILPMLTESLASVISTNNSQPVAICSAVKYDKNVGEDDDDDDNDSINVLTVMINANLNIYCISCAAEYCRVVGQSIVTDERTESTYTEIYRLHRNACINTGD